MGVVDQSHHKSEAVAMMPPAKPMVVGFKALSGSESGTYESESSNRARTDYGSEQYADTYSVNSYVVE